MPTNDCVSENTMSKLLEEEHPQLFHYTSAAGLDGILRTQTLRATHYAYLNDASEVKHFLEKRLPEIFQDVILKNIGNVKTTIPTGKQFADPILKKLLYSTAGKEPLAEPYITSFCTPKAANDRVDQHGLLSQWRGYGRDGGYALVFDTAKLSALLTETSTKFENSGDLFGGDVIYSSEGVQKFLDEFSDDVNTMKTFLLNQLHHIEDNDILQKIYIAIMRCACRYKHWGFEEENEVRIIYIPNNKEVRELAKADGISVNEMQRKQYTRSGTNIPFIELLEGITSPTRPLPISRIIVGPCAEQEKARRVRAVEILLSQYGIDAKVSPSEIPYIG
jgi:Protein of unknown function (DUF2971)